MGVEPGPRWQRTRGGIHAYDIFHIDSTTTQMCRCGFACAHICNNCSDEMIGMHDHGGQKDHETMAKCIRLCRECAEICLVTAQWVSRASVWSEQITRLCADVCDQCAEACERHAPQHALCGPCAEECRRCASTCRALAGSPVGK